MESRDVGTSCSSRLTGSNRMTLEEILVAKITKEIQEIRVFYFILKIKFLKIQF